MGVWIHCNRDLFIIRGPGKFLSPKGKGTHRKRGKRNFLGHAKKDSQKTTTTVEMKKESLFQGTIDQQGGKKKRVLCRFGLKTEKGGQNIETGKAVNKHTINGKKIKSGPEGITTHGQGLEFRESFWNHP